MLILYLYLINLATYLLSIHYLPIKTWMDFYFLYVDSLFIFG